VLALRRAPAPQLNAVFDGRMAMNEGVRERIRHALQRVRGCSTKLLTRTEWQSSLLPGGVPTRLPAPLSPHAPGLRGVEVPVVAASTHPWTSSPGYHVVRRDPSDAPNIYNTDSYDVVEDLTKEADCAEVCRVAGLSTDAAASCGLSDFVFVVGPRKRPDHHSPTVPSDIAGSKDKP